MGNKNNNKKVINCKFHEFFWKFSHFQFVWNDSNSVFLQDNQRNNLNI